MCLFSGPRGSCVLGSKEWELQGKAESSLKESSSIHLPACAVKLMRRLFGTIQHCCCIVAFASTAFKSKGREKEIKLNFF